MYHAVRSQEVKKVLSIEGPALLTALFIAATFYKFGSFILEMLAFLPTWFGISFLYSNIGQKLGWTSQK